MCTEVIAENLDANKNTYIGTMDAQKAFDLVSHNSLLRRLYSIGIQENWSMYAGLIRGIEIKVKIDGSLSRPVCIHQGTGQGRYISSENYKVFINPLLNVLKKAGCGAHIGPFYCGCPTCADDILIITDSEPELQMGFDIVLSYSTDERYIIHPAKSSVTMIKSPKQQQQQPTRSEWALGENTVPLTEKFTHLGIDRYANTMTSDTFIEDRIQLARRTAYAMMGAGLHGTNGLNPQVSRKIYLTYVLTRMTFGLESMIVTPKQVQTLEKYHRHTLRRLLSLPERVASCAIYLLMGIPPMEAILDIKVLTLFGTIASQEDSILRQVALRQLATKTLKSRSWFVRIVKIAAKYQLPSPHFLLQHPPKQQTWKKIVKKYVLRFWENSLIEEATTKSSLAFLNTKALTISKLHHSIATVQPDTRDIPRCRIKLRMLTGTYVLQYNRHKFNQHEVNPTCPLCEDGIEDQTHFIGTCKTLERDRKKMLHPLITLIGEGNMKVLRSTPTLFAKFILDHTALRASPHASFTEQVDVASIELHSRRFLFNLHAQHFKLSQDIADSNCLKKAALNHKRGKSK